MDLAHHVARDPTAKFEGYLLKVWERCACREELVDGAGSVYNTAKGERRVTSRYVHCMDPKSLVPVRPNKSKFLLEMMEIVSCMDAACKTLSP